MSEEPLLDVRDLVVSFRTERGVLRALDGISLRVPRGVTVGLVGESGSGKSVTSLAIMRLLPRHARIEAGSIRLGGRELTSLAERELVGLRGRNIGMVFQEPMTSLNPVFSIGMQLREALCAHRKLDGREARKRALALLDRVGIAAASERIEDYPHQLSGGMRQRVMIAIALAGEPELLIADEPTTALDVTIQAQILDLLSELQRELSMSVLLITHDLGVVAEHAREAFVMYAGRVVEHASTRELLRAPAHPYTRALLESVPSHALRHGKRRLPTIAGLVPDLLHLPPGCRFEERCTRASARCREEDPALRSVGAAHEAACVFAGEPAEAP